jgi:hypothetical protein
VGQPGDPHSESLTGMIGIVPAVMYVCRPCGCITSWPCQGARSGTISADGA